MPQNLSGDDVIILEFEYDLETISREETINLVLYSKSYGEENVELGEIKTFLSHCV